MQIRKLVKSGLSSYTIALPKDWIDRNTLKKGDLLYINETPQNELLIAKEAKKQEKERREVVINIDGKKPHKIYREIVSTYLTDFHRFIIKGQSLNKNIKDIRKLIYILPALEIVEESSSKVVARSFLDVYDISIKDLIRRMDNIIRSMILDVKNMLGGESIHEIIIERDEDINRLSYLVFKILKSAFTNPDVMTSLDLTKLETLSYWQVTVHLEKIGDEVKRVARHIGESPKSISQAQLKSLIEKVYSYYVESMTSFYKQDKIGADDVCLKRKSLAIECDKYFISHRNIVNSEISGKFKGMLSHLIDITRLVRYLGESP